MKIVKAEHKEPVKYYAVGDVIRVGTNYFLLAKTAINEVNLFGLDDGNRWSNPCTVKNDYVITHEEMKSFLKDCEFELIKNAFVTV